MTSINAQTFWPCFAGRMALLSGWRRYGGAMLVGAAATAALPPFHLIPLLWLSFPILLWLMAGAEKPRQAFWIGWCFAFGHHVPGLYWISVALFVDIGRFWFMLPPAVLGLPALLALFAGVGCLIHHLLVRRFALGGLSSALLFALCWVAMEWLRGHAFTGFPWNLIGYVWMPVLPVLQSLSLVGTYGLSLVTVAAAALPVLLGDTRRPLGQTIRPVLTGFAVLALLAGWGGWRLATDGQGTVPGVMLRLVQPNIDQSLKWAPGAKLANLRKTIALSAADGWENVTHVIWPETAIPYFMQVGGTGESQVLAQSVGRIAPPQGALITGVPRLGQDGEGRERYYNSLMAITADGTITASFDKFHLVPFGEYLPLRDWLPDGINAVAASAADFTPGPGPRGLHLAGLPAFSPLICYEVIFPAAVMPGDDGMGRPRWMLNLTNDAWYGHSTGPYQHFAITAARAVEEGVPIVRAANTGISGVVDAYGRVTARLGLGAEGHIDAPLPEATATPPLYARFGDWMLLGLMALTGGLVILFRNHGRLQK